MKDLWEELEQGPRPDYVADVVEVPFRRFAGMLSDRAQYEPIIRALYAGYVFIPKGAFSAGFMRETRQAVQSYFADQPSTFHKMLEGSPDFHRLIDVEAGKKYSFPCCKHSYYFYRWNGDPLGLFEEADKVWRPVKRLMGLRDTEYELNTPKDGVVDRVQIVRYPPLIC